MAPSAVLALLLAAPAPAAVVELVPLALSPSAPAFAVPALPRPAALLPGPLLLTGLSPVLPAPAVPLLPAPLPLALRPALPAAARPVEGPKEDADALVRRLLAKNREAEQELSATFDGTVLEGAPAVGAEVETRNGAHTLSGSRVKTEGGTTTVYERWTGPGGETLWVLRRRGPDVWEVREWRGEHMPAAFDPSGPPLPPSHYAEYSIKEGRLRSNIETDGGGKRPPSTMIDAKKSFAEALAWFGTEVVGVKGTWVYGTNLEEFNRLTGEGLPPEEAALRTWTGRQAAAAGFRRVVFSPRVLEILKKGKPGAYEEAAALFLKP